MEGFAKLGLLLVLVLISFGFLAKCSIDLYMENMEYREQLNTSQASIADQQEEVNSLLSENDVLRSQNAALHRELDQANKQNEALRMENADLRAEVLFLRTVEEIAVDQITELQAQIGQLAEERDRLKLANSVQRHEIDLLDYQVKMMLAAGEIFVLIAEWSEGSDTAVQAAGILALSGLSIAILSGLTWWLFGKDTLRLRIAKPVRQSKHGDVRRGEARRRRRE